MAEYSPVTDFKEARCRQYDVKDCSRGGYCNFMHLKVLLPVMPTLCMSASLYFATIGLPLHAFPKTSRVRIISF